VITTADIGSRILWSGVSIYKKQTMDYITIGGAQEYDVYVLTRQKKGGTRFSGGRNLHIKFVVGSSFASAEEEAKAAELKTNALGSKAIGIAADAIVYCR
jgi:hypothetical protein